MSKTADKTDPKLWEKVKEEITQSDKGGNKGQWSARKAQIAVQEYKKRGGGYEDDDGPDDDNSLHEWTEEDWGTKSGEESGKTGERYLPKEAREKLTNEEYRRTSDKKREDTAKGKQFSQQPADVAEKAAEFRDGGEGAEEPTKRELYDAAKKMDVPGRSKMDKGELQDALADRSDGAGASGEPSKQDLYEEAKRQDVEGRSKMDKNELRKAVRDS